MHISLSLSLSLSIYIYTYIMYKHYINPTGARGVNPLSYAAFVLLVLLRDRDLPCQSGSGEQHLVREKGAQGPWAGIVTT